jgi:hypothetical protein
MPRAATVAIASALLIAVAGCGSDGNSSAPDLSVALDLSPPGDMVVLNPECDVFANTGCAVGQKCTVGTQNGTPRDLCFAIAATTVGEGAACMSVADGSGRTGDNCVPGLICLDFPGDGPHCRQPCYVRAHCPGGSACVLTTPTSTQRMTEGGVEFLHACAVDEGCDPVAQTVCAGARHCWLSPPDDVGRVGICLVSLKSGMAGDSCAAQAECAPGFRCDDLHFCRRYCYFEMPDGGVAAGVGACPAGEGFCGRFGFSPPLYGICGAE